MIKNVLMLNYEYPPLGGGASPVTRELAVTLKQQYNISVDVVTMGFDELPSRESDNGVEVYRVPCLRRSKEESNIIEMASYLLPAIIYGKKLLNRRQYDIIHSHFLIPTGVVGAVLNSSANIPHVVTSHGSDVPGYNPDDYGRTHMILEPITKRLAHKVDNIVTPSEYLQNLIQTRYKIEDQRTQIIPYGFYPKKIAPASDKEDRILMISRLLKRKGFQRVLRALDEVETEFEIRIAGEGPYKERLMEVAKSINHEVKFLGWLEGESLFDEYSKSQIFLLPSVSDNYPVSIMEAMAGGNAIITSEDSGCAEVVGDAGVLVDPSSTEEIRNAIQSLLNDSEWRKALQRAARRRIENDLSWDSIANQYVDLYESVKKQQNE